MRRWHKLLAPWFALLLFVIALTGALTQLTAIVDVAPKAAAPSAPSEAGGTRHEARSTAKTLNHWIKKLHSGQALGPVGIALNLAAGAALLFFAGSGFWMYLSMWLRQRRNRRARTR